MKKVFTFLKKHFLLLATFSTLSLVITYFIVLPTLQDYRAKKDIATGDLQYFAEIGWVDMGHANPDGPTKLVAEIDKHRGGTLTYSQDMKKKLFGLTFVVRRTNRYSIPVDLDNKRAGILRYVLEDVSKDFEKLQGSHPFKALCGKSIGDINGDRLALLRSLKLKCPTCIDHPVEPEIALKKFENNDNLTATSGYLKKFLPTPVWVYRYDSKVECFFM